jgi:serine/threonine-protein kinase RsbW
LLLVGNGRCAAAAGVACEIMSEAADAPAGAVPAPVVVDAMPAPVLLASEPFTAEELTVVRHRLGRCVTAAGLTGGAGEDFVLAIYELMTNAVRHAGGRGVARLLRVEDALTCEVVDHGGGQQPHVGVPRPDVPGGRGLWLAQQLTDSLMLMQRGDGVTATVSVCLPAVALPQGRAALAAPNSAGVTLSRRRGSGGGHDTEGTPG